MRSFCGTRYVRGWLYKGDQYHIIKGTGEQTYYIRESLPLINRKSKNWIPKIATPPAREAKNVESEIPWVCCALSLPLFNGSNTEVGVALGTEASAIVGWTAWALALEEVLLFFCGQQLQTRISVIR